MSALSVYSNWLTRLIKQSQISATELPSMLWYHGTDSVTAYNLMNEMTLKPRNETGESSYEGGLSSIPTAVYLTSTPGKAAKHAIERVEQYKGTHPVIVVIQPENLGYAHVDEDLVHQLLNGNDYFGNGDWYPSPKMIEEIFAMAADDLRLDNWESGKSDQQLVLEHLQYVRENGSDIGSEEEHNEYMQDEGIVPDAGDVYEYDESMHLAKSIAASLNNEHQREAITNFQSMAHEGKVLASEIYLIPERLEDGSFPTNLTSYEELKQSGTRINPEQLLMSFMRQI